MAFSRTSRHTSALRFAAGAALSVLTLTGCNVLDGETTIDAVPAPAVASAPAATAAPVATTAPVIVSAPPATAVPISTEDAAPTATEDAVPISTEDAAPTATEDADVPAQEETETTAFNITASDCMDGRWISRAGEVGRYMEVVGEDTGVAMQSSGYIIIVLENGHYSYDAQITTNIDVDGVAATSVIDGVTTGNYEYVTNDGNPYIEAEQQAGEISGYVDVLGTRIDASELGTDFNQAANFHQVQYDCGADPTFWFQTVPGFPRHDVHFEAWDGTRP